MPCPAATLTVWASAWLAGVAAGDDVLDALEPWAEGHDVLAGDEDARLLTGLPAAPQAATSVAFLLAAIRRGAGGSSGPARLVLPAPGDVRGLPGPGLFSSAATAAEQGVLLPEAGLGLVPSWAADGVLRWTVYAITEVGPSSEHVPLTEAEHGLRDQVRRSASILTSLGVARHRPGVREEIAATLRARPSSMWPAGMPGHALRVLQHADEVEAILAAASADDPGGALDAAGARARADALRPIATAVRVARLAAVADAVRVLAGRAGRR